MSELPTHVDIREVSLRDGLQIEEPIPLSAKLEMLEAVVATGVREMEATAFVSPSKVPALADAAELAAELRQLPDARHRVLRAGGQPQRRQARDRGGPADRSSTWCRRPTGTAAPTSAGPPPRPTALIAEIVAIAHDSGASVEVIVATAWDCPFDGPTPPQRVLDIVTAACDSGVDRLAIADTIGTTTPRRVSDLVAQVRPLIGDIPLGAHFHNTRGAGLASAYAAVTAGHHPARRLGRRPRRLPVRAGRQRQHRHRGPGLPVAGQRDPRRRRPAGRDRRGRGRAGRRRTRPAERAAARRRPHPRRVARARRDAERQGPPDPARPSSRPPGSCSPSAVFTAPRWPTSRRRRASRLRCSTATSPTRRTCWPRWPSPSCTTSWRRRG